MSRSGQVAAQPGFTHAVFHPAGLYAPASASRVLGKTVLEALLKSGETTFLAGWFPFPAEPAVSPHRAIGLLGRNMPLLNPYWLSPFPTPLGLAVSRVAPSPPAAGGCPGSPTVPTIPLVPAAAAGAALAAGPCGDAGSQHRNSTSTLDSSCQVHDNIALLLRISGRELAFWQLSSTEFPFSYFCYKSELPFLNGSDQFSQLIRVSVQFRLFSACPSF